MTRPVIHRLVRDGQPFPRVDRRRRPDQARRCSCGVKLYGTSRREALPMLQLHRADTLETTR